MIKFVNKRVNEESDCTLYFTLYDDQKDPQVVPASNIVSVAGTIEDINGTALFTDFTAKSLISGFGSRTDGTFIYKIDATYNVIIDESTRNRTAVEKHYLRLKVVATVLGVATTGTELFELPIINLRGV
jgi:hypothetical protein